MRIVKLAGISFLLLFTVMLVISLFIPSRVRISRAMDITAHPDTVLRFIARPAGWTEWIPGMEGKELVMEQEQVKGVVTGEDPYRTLILDSTTTNGVAASFRGSKQRAATTVHWKVNTQPGSQQVTVQWYMDFKLRWYPWEKFASLLFEKNYGTLMEKGLGNLKGKLESR